MDAELQATIDKVMGDWQQRVVAAVERQQNAALPRIAELMRQSPQQQFNEMRRAFAVAAVQHYGLLFNPAGVAESTHRAALECTRVWAELDAKEAKP